MANPHTPAAIHEESLIRAFVAQGKRERLLKLLATPKGRRKLVDQLAHFYDLDPRFAHRIPPNEQTVEGIYGLLRGKGAPETCYALGDSQLDGREVALREALEAIVNVSFGNFLSCIPGRLGYFGGEEPNERYILER
jgi:hypothetical protein